MIGHIIILSLHKLWLLLTDGATSIALLRLTRTEREREIDREILVSHATTVETKTKKLFRESQRELVSTATMRGVCTISNGCPCSPTGWRHQ
jgi:hypothetical protein